MITFGERKLTKAHKSPANRDAVSVDRNVDSLIVGQGQKDVFVRFGCVGAGETAVIPVFFQIQC